MKTILLIMALSLLPQYNVLAQSEFEIAAAAMTLTRLSEKAQIDRDASSLIVYQNAWLELKEDYPELEDHPTFIQTNQFFEQVNAAYASSVGTISYNMNGLENVVLPDSGGQIAVVDAPLGWSYSWQIPDCNDVFDSGVITAKDIQVMKAVRTSESGADPITLNKDQISAASEYYERLGKSIFKNKDDNTFTNVDALTSKELEKLKKYRERQKEVQIFKKLQQQELVKPTDSTNRRRIRSRELNRIRTSIQRVNSSGSDGGGG